MSDTTAERTATDYGIDHRFTERAELAYGQMLWYCWGRSDATGSTEGTTLDDGFRVARLYRNAAEDFVLEVSYCLDSILSFYAKHITDTTTEGTK